MSNENTGENENESSVIRDLRKQLKEANERLSTLAPLAKESAFEKAGVDLSDPRNKFFVEHYDGDLTPEAIREAAEPYGFVSSGEQQEAEQQPAPEESQRQRVEGLRQQSTPDGAGQRIPHNEWLALSKNDPRAAQDAFQNGLVDFPPHIAPALQQS